MKFSQASLLLACLPSINARYVEKNEVDNVMLQGLEEKFLIETAPGVTRWVTDDEKWELRRNGQNFMDITADPEFKSLHLNALGDDVKFPTKLVKQDTVNALNKQISKKEMRSNLEKLTSFFTRYYRSDYGLQSSQWVLKRVREIIAEADANATVSADSFTHNWKQNSVIARIPGRSDNTIVIGAHQDSTNLWLPSVLGAPGADDDGSGTVTIMEVFRNLIGSKDIASGEALNTIEFHWYSAEEGGLLGSQDIFRSYSQDGRKVKAMLQQDMTGYVQGTLNAGKPEAVGVITDFVHKDLTRFIKKVIEEYCTIPWEETKCGYACSDHASASKYGYPSAFVIESAFENSNQKIHSTDDLIKHLSFDHMAQHGRMTLGWAYELAYHDFAASNSDEL